MTDVKHINLHSVPGLPGVSTVAIGKRDGKVVLLMDKPAQWIGLDTATAFMVAEKIARECYAIHNGHEAPVGDAVLMEAFKSKYTEELRTKMVNRTMLMLRSLEDQNKSPLFRAQALVDSILNLYES